MKRVVAVNLRCSVGLPTDWFAWLDAAFTNQGRVIKLQRFI